MRIYYSLIFALILFIGCKSSNKTISCKNQVKVVKTKNFKQPYSYQKINKKKVEKLHAQRKEKISEIETKKPLKEEVFASTNEEVIVSENPIQERQLNKLRNSFEKDPDYESFPVNHNESLYAFVTYLIGPIFGYILFLLGIYPISIFGFLFAVMSPLIGLLWAIKNVLFLADKKDKYLLKELSLVVIILSMISLIALFLMLLGSILSVGGLGMRIIFGIFVSLALLHLIPLLHYINKK